MEPRNDNPYERTRLVSGVKTAAFVVILGALALIVDHVFFVAPYANTPTVAGSAVATRPANVTVEGFVVPENLRPTTADVQPPPSTF